MNLSKDTLILVKSGDSYDKYRVLASSGNAVCLKGDGFFRNSFWTTIPELENLGVQVIGRRVAFIFNRYTDE